MIGLPQTTKVRTLLASEPEPTELRLRGGNSEKYSHQEEKARGHVREWVLLFQV